MTEWHEGDDVRLSGSQRTYWILEIERHRVWLVDKWGEVISVLAGELEGPPFARNP